MTDTLTPLDTQANAPVPATAPLPPFTPVPFTPVVPSSEALLPNPQAPLTMPMTVDISNMEEHVRDGFFDIEAYIKKEVGKGIKEYQKLRTKPVIKGNKFTVLNVIKFLIITSVILFLMSMLFIDLIKEDKKTPVEASAVVAPVVPIKPIVHSSSCHKEIGNKPIITNLGE